MKADSATFPAACLPGEDVVQEDLDLMSDCVTPDTKSDQDEASSAVQDALDLVTPVFSATEALPLFHKIC
jgi:hypothetical protein